MTKTGEARSEGAVARCAAQFRQLGITGEAAILAAKHEVFERRVAALEDRKLSRAVAMREAAKGSPDLHAAWIAWANHPDCPKDGLRLHERLHVAAVGRQFLALGGSLEAASYKGRHDVFEARVAALEAKGLRHGQAVIQVARGGPWVHQGWREWESRLGTLKRFDAQRRAFAAQKARARSVLSPPAAPGAGCDDGPASAA